MRVRKDSKRWLVLAPAVSAATLAMVILSRPTTADAQTATSSSSTYFDWSVTQGNGIAGTGNGGTDSTYTPAPFLTDANVASVYAFLASRTVQNSSLPLAIKITAPISATTASEIFGTFNIKYVFADFESSSATSQTAALVAQIHAAGSKSTKAFVGNFGYFPYTTLDSTYASGGTTTTQSFQNATNPNTYKNSGANMANEAAYPGSPDFLSQAQSGAPNIRSALFILPIDRVTYATDFLAKGTYPDDLNSEPAITSANTGANIPWIARFDNSGNSLLNNDGNNSMGTPGSSKNPSGVSSQGYQYAFNTDDPKNPQYQNQLLSRGDFSAQVLQYRLRGATSYNMLNYSLPGSAYASVIGYTVAEEQSDAEAGWTGGGNSTLAAIWGRNNYGYANVVNEVPLLVTTTSGKTTTQKEVNSSSVKTGMVLSGIYDLSGATRQLALLLSNMSAATQTVDFVQKYGGDSVNLGSAGTGALDQYYTIAPGTHDLLTFNLTNGKWMLFANDQIFADSNRNGIGVPEPTSLALLGLASMGMMLRRRPRPRPQT